ncbi:(2Fe-2S)-binding protein [Denitrobaculum tricleocarpae]|uniref:Bacterioferritin-associated ferredoxin n=1 Tax=Denitrobaculum tricleocarpae TaxID=2591009 RepID=A0A545U119_9PROT|nr:(2Fe-2S)-binding protein [Denitrobaculum tricleocarpae]TQV83148.1 hypothetical protein FKG95_00665 [Denitrobaculum tricleocarpae]
MYVCLCNGYRDSEISEIARDGVRCAKRAYFAMGSGPRCGQCLDMAQDIIDDVHESESSACSSYPTANDRQLAATGLPVGGGDAPVTQRPQVSFSKS